jgi:hypothetical protein
MYCSEAYNTRIMEGTCMPHFIQENGDDLRKDNDIHKQGDVLR